MPKNINEQAQARRRKDAVQSALSSSALLLLTALLLLFLRRYCPAGSFWGALLLVFSVLDLGMIIPVWCLLKMRLKEIEGGEEDVASQY